MAPRWDLLCVGEAFEDLIFTGLPRVPRLGEELLAQRFARVAGGGALITAVRAARLGLRVALAAPLPSFARAGLGGIAVHDLLRPGEPHAVTCALSTSRDRAFATFPGGGVSLHTRLLRAGGELGQRARHVHFAFIPPRLDAATRVLARLRARRVTASWDFGHAPALARAPSWHEFLRELEILFVNEAEARSLGGRPRLTSEVRCLVVKQGAKGARVFEDGAELHATAPKRRVVDTTGAGDAFAAGFLSERLRGESLKRALLAGVHEGTRAVGTIGGLPAPPREVL